MTQLKDQLDDEVNRYSQQADLNEKRCLELEKQLIRAKEDHDLAINEKQLLAYELEQKASCVCPKAAHLANESKIDENKENFSENRSDLIAKVKDLET